MKNFKKLVLPALAMASALVFASCNQEDINRSEERRVGKECRARWEAEH